MKKFSILFLISLSLCFSSCEKMLELEQKDALTSEIYFNVEDDAKKALAGAYDVLAAQNLHGGYMACRSFASDEQFISFTGQYPANFNVTGTDPLITSHWQLLWRAIERTNILLENLDRVKMDAVRKEYIRGEALFLRGYCHFFLADLWGPIPIKLTRTEGANDVARARQPLRDVYAQVIADMVAAEALVPTTDLAGYGGAGYPAKTTVQAMLARVYLTMAGEPLKDVARYQDAKAWAQKVISSGEHALNTDYADVFIKLASDQFDKKEILWQIDFKQFTGQPVEGGSWGYLDGVTQNNLAFGRSLEQVKVTQPMYRRYAAGTVSPDSRRDWNIANFSWRNNTTVAGAEADKVLKAASSIWGRACNKYRRQYNANKEQTGTGVNFPVMRYSDVLLMWAEADNEINGPTPQATAYVNLVRQRAYGKLKSGATNIEEANMPTGLDKFAFREFIQDERSRELCFEGIRKHDLTRWGNYVSALRNIFIDANLPGTVIDSFNRDSRINANNVGLSEKDVLWPIPSVELTLNPLMTQNPGW